VIECIEIKAMSKKETKMDRIEMQIKNHYNELFTEVGSLEKPYKHGIEAKIRVSLVCKDHW